MRVLISCPQLQRTIDSHRERLEREGIQLLLPPVVQALSEAEMLELAPELDGAIVGDDVVSAAVLARADRLRVVSKWGVGIDNIDLEAAAARGVRVTNTPGVFADEVADVVIGYLILLARRLHTVDRSVRTGDWTKIEGVSLAGRTLGIIGLGAIGQAVARRAIAMRMLVIGHDVSAEQERTAEAMGAQVRSQAEILAEADALTLNCPLTSQNRHMIGASALHAMKPGAWIINTARGALIDEMALVDALASGQIGAAALDVFEAEPLPASSPLRGFDSVILGSHNASNTAEAVRRTSELAIDNLLAGLVAARP